MNNRRIDSDSAMNVLVIGAYGLIGSGIARRLMRDGHAVTGLGRDIATGKRVLPDVHWIGGDLRSLTEIDAWRPVLKDIDVVVNCSGALQDGPEDDLEVVHHLAVSAMANACVATKQKIIQISAVGAALDARTVFLASKARGDAAIKSSGAAFHIFRPGLVLAPSSYGGTTMLRMLAAVPILQPIAEPKAQVQTIAIDDLATVVSAAIDGKIPTGFEGDLVEAEIHSLRTVVAAMRHWLGFNAALRAITIPSIGVRAIGPIADGLAHLGWRSPLRTTTMQVLSDGVTGHPTDVTRFGLAPLKSLTQTLNGMPARAEDRLFARMALVTPIIIATLILFWCASGIIGILKAQQAALVLEDVGWSHALAVASVLFWALVDMAIAVAFALRRYARTACWLAVAVSLFYLTASTLVVPHLWFDPLGPLVKVIPGMALALVARIALETR